MRGRLQLGVSALLRLPRLPLAAKLMADGRTYAAKKEFHVTLLDGKTTATIGASRIAAATYGRVVFEVDLLDELWMVERGRGATIIRMCNVAGGAELFRDLALPMPPLHVTLYTSGVARGIGLPSFDALRSLGTALPAEVCRALLSEMRESP